MPPKNQKIYGSWLKKKFNYSDVKKSLDTLHDDTYPRFKTRVEHYEKVAARFLTVHNKIYPELAGKMAINFAAINGGLARYFNDVVHYKLWHPITYINKARVIAYSISWSLLYNPISLTLSRSEYANLSVDARKFALKINIHFSLFLMKWYLKGFGIPNKTSIVQIQKRIAYLIQTNQFDPKNIAVAFEIAS